MNLQCCLFNVFAISKTMFTVYSFIWVIEFIIYDTIISDVKNILNVQVDDY